MFRFKVINKPKIILSNKNFNKQKHRSFFYLSLISTVIILSACASLKSSNLSHKEKVLYSSAAGALAGGVYGSQKNTYKEQNTALYSSLGAATGSILGVLAFDEEKEKQELIKETKTLKEKLDAIEKSQAPKLISEGKSLLSAPLPKDVSKLIRPGEWRRYKIDYWVQDPANAYLWYRQSEMFEVIPPGISE